MDNATMDDNVTASHVDIDGIIVYHVLFMVFTTIPITIVNIALVIAIALEKSLCVPIRIVFVNTPISGLMVLTGSLINHLSVFAAAAADSEPPEAICRLAFFTWKSGDAGRLAFMALYSITVMLIVRFKASKLKPVYMVSAVIGVWLFVCLFTIWFFVPSAYSYFFDEASCVPLQGTGVAATIVTIIYCLVFGLGCFAITIIVPSVTLWYIKKNTVTEDSKITAGLAKFAFFLLIGNTVNIIGGIVPAILAGTIAGNFSPTGHVRASFSVLAIISVSVIPTPIIIIIYFKNIRKRLFPCCYREKKVVSIASNSSSST